MPKAEGSFNGMFPGKGTCGQCAPWALAPGWSSPCTCEAHSTACACASRMITHSFFFPPAFLPQFHEENTAWSHHCKLRAAFAQDNSFLILLNSPLTFCQLSSGFSCCISLNRGLQVPLSSVVFRSPSAIEATIAFWSCTFQALFLGVIFFPLYK